MKFDIRDGVFGTELTVCYGGTVQEAMDEFNKEYKMSLETDEDHEEAFGFTIKIGPKNYIMYLKEFENGLDSGDIEMINHESGHVAIMALKHVGMFDMSDAFAEAFLYVQAFFTRQIIGKIMEE